MFTLKREHTGCIRKFSRNIFAQAPLEYIAPVMVARHGDLRDLEMRKCFAVRRYNDFLSTYDIGKLIVGIFLYLLSPAFDDAAVGGEQFFGCLRVHAFEKFSGIYSS